MRDGLLRRIEWYRGRLRSLSRRYVVARILDRVRVHGRRLLHQVLPTMLPRVQWTAGWDTARVLALDGLPGTWTASRAQTIARVRRCAKEFPAAAARLQQEVDRLAAGRVSLPIAGDVAFDPAGDWHRDPITGAMWPLVYGRSIDLARPAHGRDPKVLWHAGRMHHVVHLAVAHILGDARASQLVTDHLEGFRRLNPFPLGLHWSSPMESAVRSIQVLWTIHLLGDALAREVRAKWLDLLHAHAVFIEENLEDQEALGGVNGNHLVVNLVGLLALGFALPCFERSMIWIRRSTTLLAREMKRQVTSDGMDYENSTGYHRFVVEACVQGAALAQSAGMPFDRPTLDTLGRMTGWLAAVMRPDGSLPLLGDFDGGRIFAPFPAAEDDASGVLSMAAAITGLGAEPRAEAYLVAGSAPEAPVARPTLEVFQEAGVVVARATGAHVVCAAWGTGLKGTGAHSHADAGAFDLWAEGAPLLVDPGTYVYSADIEARNRFRATSAHNTVTVDGRELLDWDPLQLFVASGDRRPGLRRLQDHPIAWEVELLPALDPFAGLRLVRQYRLDSAGHALEILDHLEGQGSHRMEAWLHFTPGSLSSVAPGTWHFAREAVVAQVQVDADAVCAVDQGWVSDRYGARVAAPVLRIVREGIPPFEWRIRVAWSPRLR